MCLIHGNQKKPPVWRNIFPGFPYHWHMKDLHALVLACLAPCLALSVLADATSLSPFPGKGRKTGKTATINRWEQLRNNPCGVLFLGDSITDYWDIRAELAVYRACVDVSAASPVAERVNDQLL